MIVARNGTPLPCGLSLGDVHQRIGMHVRFCKTGPNCEAPILADLRTDATRYPI